MGAGGQAANCFGARPDSGDVGISWCVTELFRLCQQATCQPGVGAEQTGFHAVASPAAQSLLAGPFSLRKSCSGMGDGAAPSTPGSEQKGTKETKRSYTPASGLGSTSPNPHSETHIPNPAPSAPSHQADRSDQSDRCDQAARRASAPASKRPRLHNLATACPPLSPSPILPSARH